MIKSIQVKDGFNLRPNGRKTNAHLLSTGYFLELKPQHQTAKSGSDRLPENIH
jgi:hypothetical protein